MTALRATVDVVIPVKYGERFLPESVASALDQTGATMRVVVVDDGAEADIGPLLEGFPADSVRLVVNGGAPGIGGARNFGAGLGDAPFLAFLDADDVWPAQRTEELLRALGEPARCDMAFGLVEQFVDGDPGAFRVPAALSPGMLPGGMLMRRSAWTQIGPFDEQLVLGEFVDWLARARSMGLRESSIDSVVLRRRIHGDNTTIHRREDRAAYADVIRRHLRRQDGL